MTVHRRCTHTPSLIDNHLVEKKEEAIKHTELKMQCQFLYDIKSFNVPDSLPVHNLPPITNIQDKTLSLDRSDRSAQSFMQTAVILSGQLVE